MQKEYLTEVVLLTKSYNLQDFKDWLKWHLEIIGFDHCHVFDNESSVDIKSVCDSYGSKVSYEKIIGWVNQYELYNRYINNESHAWWVLPIDDDEFLWMKNFKNVNKMILYYQGKWADMNKLSIRWKNMFPKDPHAKRGELSLMEFNTESNEKWAKLFVGGNMPVKTFVKTTNKVFYDESSSQTHNPIILEKMSYMCNGKRLKGNWFRTGPYNDDDVKILHFQYKSEDEWRWKCKNRLAIFGNKKFIYTKGQENIIDKMI